MKKPIALLLFLILPWMLVAQTGKSDTLRKPWNHFSLSVGLGWSHYINSLENTGNGDVRLDFAGTSLKFFWEPEHRLSLGLETGYYKIFKITAEVSPGVTGESNMKMVPLLLVARMRIVDHFYLSAAPGLALLFTDVKGVGEDATTTQFSLSAFQASASYLYPVSKRFDIGGVFEFLAVGKTNDYLYTLQAVCSVKL